MDDIMRRIADIVDHEGFDGDGTLGEQVADRLLPTLTYIWDRAHEVDDHQVSRTDVKDAIHAVYAAHGNWAITDELTDAICDLFGIGSANRHQ